MIKVDNAKKLQWLWRDENRIEWIKQFVKIADKSGNVVPFIPTVEQEEFITNLDNKNIILKSRQLGLSSIVIAESIREVVTRENCTSALISHNQTSCNAVFEKLKAQYNSLPDWIKPKTIQNNRQALCFANGSSIVCMTAGSKDILRGSTITGICHLSEFAFWNDPERHLKALSQACSASSKIVIETTANGFNKFSELYFQSKNKENDYKVYFFNWINGRTLFEDQYKIAVEKYKSTHKGQMLTEEDLDEEERQLVENGATMDQIIWRRSKISVEGLDSFHQEYPATDMECFISTGHNVFDTKRISRKLSGKFPSPISEDKLTIDARLLPWIKNGALKIFKIPRANKRYWVGVDVSEGVGQDYSTAFAIDKNGENVFTFRNNRIKPYELADVMALLGKYYNNALLVVEKASGGHTVIERLKYDYQYHNLSKYKTYDQFNHIVWNPGFDTNQKTKSIAVNDAREWFDKGLVRINDRIVLEEMKTFIVDNHGGMNAADGTHDDMISAMWLCIQGAKSPYWYI